MARTVVNSTQLAWLKALGVDPYWLQAAPSPAEAAVAEGASADRSAAASVAAKVARRVSRVDTPIVRKTLKAPGTLGAPEASGTTEAPRTPEAPGTTKTPEVPVASTPPGGPAATAAGRGDALADGLAPASFAACENLDEVYARVRAEWGSRAAAGAGQGAQSTQGGALAIVPGAGMRTNPRYLIVGEQPSLADELAGQPFQGDSGKLLATMLATVSLPQRDSCYLTYVLKARLESGRTPRADEVAASLPGLRREIELLQPQWILALGQVAARALLASSRDFAELCGRPHRYEAGAASIPLWVTHQPASLLVRSADKAQAWRDLLAFASAVQSRDPSGR